MEPWWREPVIYQVYPRSFADGSGDGVGDIAGIRSRLPYLAGLGVDAIWINPWYPSPQVDGGYDVADYRAIDPVFGTIGDAEAMVADCHAHGLRVILDLVPNHTSDQHPWFRAALAGPPGSAERARYVFRAGRGVAGELPPTNWPSAFGGPAWNRVSDGEWFLRIFAPGQPDLNWANPEVRSDFENTLRFWFDRGVDGFRVDAASGLVKDPAYPDLRPDFRIPDTPPFGVEHPAWDQDGVHDIYRSWRKLADTYDPPRIFIGEAWGTTPERLARYVRADELHGAFNFDLPHSPWDPAIMRAVLSQTLDATAAVGSPATWVLGNHDVIRQVTRFGRTDGDQLAPAGTVATDLRLGRRRARAAALLSLALPGRAFIYQGEELGLPEVEDLPEDQLRDPTWEQSGRTIRGRDGCRVPLPWAGAEPPFGFSATGSWLNQPAEWTDLTVEAQVADPDSMLALYRAALHIRRTDLGPSAGPMRWLPSPDGVLAFARDPGFRCVVNLTAAPEPLPAHSAVLLSSTPLDDDGQLPPDSAAWLRTA